MTEASARLGNAVTAFLQAIPAERREELRAVVNAAPQTEDACVAADQSDDADDDPDGAPAAARLAPLPPRGDEESRQAADVIMQATLREANRPVTAGARRAPSLHPSAAAGPAPSPPRHIIRLSEVAPRPLHWLSPGRLAAGKITILDGDPGLGKSTLLCELAARVSRGEALPGGEDDEPRTVILMSAEDDLHDTIRPRIDATGGDPDLIVALDSLPDGTALGRPFQIPSDAPWLELFATKLDAALIIIDPLVAFLDGNLSANNDQDVRRALAALKQVGERTGAAIVAVRHLNKTSGGNPLYRGGGSIGIIGAARCGLLLAADPDDPERRILAATKGNLARPPASLAFRLEDVPGADVARVVWAGESRWSAAALLRAADEGEEDRSALADARAFLRAALADGPRPAKEVQAEAAARGISQRTLVAARKAEGITSSKDRAANGRWLVALPAAAKGDGEECNTPPSPEVRTLRTVRTLHASDETTDDDGRNRRGRADSSPCSTTTGTATERRCVDCGEGLAPWESTARCGPCLAKALTDDDS